MLLRGHMLLIRLVSLLAETDSLSTFWSFDCLVLVTRY